MGPELTAPPRGLVAAQGRGGAGAGAPGAKRPQDGSCRALEDDRGAVPARRADAREAVARAAPLHLVREREHDARTGRAEGMSERDRAAHDVELALGDAAGAVGLAFPAVIVPCSRSNTGRSAASFSSVESRRMWLSVVTG